MSFDYNTQHIGEHKDKKVYLFDTGVFARSEEIASVCGSDFIEIFSKLPEEYFFVTNEVLLELMNGPRTILPGFFMKHILNAEGAMDRTLKENRFIIEKDGNLSYIVLNKVSSVDYSQILLCQNHKELILVSNDRKLLKSAAQILPDRVIGFPTLIINLSQKYPSNKPLMYVRKVIDEHYELKNIFRLSTDKESKMRNNS